jgi:Ran GTPase-activating protein (RanGAP) involved in mRNA processing and transport
MSEVECFKYSPKYINILFDAIERSPVVEKLIFEVQKDSNNYTAEDWKLVVDRTIKCNNIKIIDLVLDFPREFGIEVANLLEKTKSIKTFAIQFPFYSAPEKKLHADYSIICNALDKNTTIDAMKISYGNSIWEADAILPLIEIVSKKEITQLELYKVHHEFMGAIYNKLHDSSIEELAIRDRICYARSEAQANLQPLGELLAKNGNIRKLLLLSTGVKDDNFGQILVPIIQSKNLKELYLTNEQMSDRCISEIIEHNASLNILMSVNFARTVEADLEFLSAALKKNTNLTRLDIQGRNINSKGYINLGEAMKVNTTLKKLYLSHNDRVNNADVAPLFGGLKFNSSLNLLAITMHISGVGYHTNELMKSNRALIDVIPREYEYETKPHPQLLRNKNNQDEVVLGGKSLVYAIHWHLESFLAWCPLEIWYNVLEQLKCPGVAINFPRALKELLQKKKKNLNNIRTISRPSRI